MSVKINHYFYFQIPSKKREFRERRLNNTSMDNKTHRPKKSRRVRPQAFYPCPPPTLSELERDYDSTDEEEDLDPSGYINTLVSVT